MGVISLGLLTEEGLLAKDLSWVLRLIIVSVNTSQAKLGCGETPHSFSLCLSNTLNMLGCSQDDVSHYLGWRSKGMAWHYTRMSNSAGSFPIPALRPLYQTPASHPSNLQCIV